jgi:hypothetical protein
VVDLTPGEAFPTLPRESVPEPIATTAKGETHLAIDQKEAGPGLVAFAPDGSVDTAFGEDGTISLKERYDGVKAGQIEVDAGGRIVGDVETAAGIAVFRLHPNGARDRTFADGHAVALRGIANDWPTQAGPLQIQPGGRIVVDEQTGYSSAPRTVT